MKDPKTQAAITRALVWTVPLLFLSWHYFSVQRNAEADAADQRVRDEIARVQTDIDKMNADLSAPPKTLTVIDAEGNSQEIYGHIRNDTGKDYSQVTFSAALYDDQNNKVGDAYAFTGSLKQGETWAFNAAVLGRHYSYWRTENVGGF